jgi:iron(III) transport system permease protein
MAATPTLAPVRLRFDGFEALAQVLLALVALFLIAFLAFPLLTICWMALRDGNGELVGLINFLNYARTPELLGNLWNSLWVSALVTVITLPLAFASAYALTRTCMPLKGVFRGITLIPLLGPSLMAAISTIYWFGNQGVLKSWLIPLGLQEIYGAPGVVLAECFAVFPHALMILVTALSLADGRLYEAAQALGTTRWRTFWTLTLPGARYGLISAGMVSFTLVITDFGIPKVIGGNFNVLATDVFKLVIGQQNFSQGAVVAILLLLPAVISHWVDQRVSRRQAAMLGARAVPYKPKPVAWIDALMGLFAALLATLMLAMLGMAVYASIVTFWPYNLTPTFKHYAMGLFDAEVGTAFFNSLLMASGAAVFGTSLVFFGAYLLEKTRSFAPLRGLLRLLAVLPMAVPGLVLGLGYIFFFNAPGNPLGGLYHSLALLTFCTVVHFYTTGHLTSITALKALDGEFEAVSASLKVPFFKTFWRVTLPVCAPALVDIARYFFINAMTTISAVVFLYSPETKVASIAILNLDEAGEMGAAAAMAVLIALASAVAAGTFTALAHRLNRRIQAWRP